MTAELLTARDRDTIRAALASRLSARFSEAGTELELRRGSDAWQETEALAVILASLEAHAEGALGQLLPDQATGSALIAHGAVGELSRGVAETPEDFRARVLAWWQERLPACGEEDLAELCEATDACDKAFVYRRLQPGSTATFTPGCVTVVALGPAQGSSATNTRVLGAATLAHVAAYLEGTEDVHGVAAPLGVQQRPLCCKAGNYAVEACTENVYNLTITLFNAPTHPFPWHYGSLTITASALGSVDVTGDYTALLGLPCLIQWNPGVARGNNVRVVITGAVFAAGTTTLSFTAPDPAVVAWVGGVVQPCPPNWEGVRDAVFAHLDQLGPGDTASPSRWPWPSSEYPSTVYDSAIRALLGRVSGVLKATVSPGGLTLASPKGVVTLQNLVIVEGT